MRRMMWLPMVLLALTAELAAANETSGLYVSGVGKVTMAPDVAHFAFEIVRQGTDAVALKREVDAVTAAVVALAEKQGVARKDITAAVIAVRPEYRYVDGRSVLEGVNVSRTIKIDLKDLARYAAISDGAIAAGVNQIVGVELDIGDRSALERKALDAAIEQATGEANHVAERLGMKLGRVLEVHLDEVAPGPIGPMVGMAMREKADDFRPGEIAVERRIQVRFDLVPL